MNDEMTERYMKSVVGPFSFTRRLIIWDSFSCHKSANTKKALKQMRMDKIIVPSGCTGLIQASDVSWNKSFKANVQREYDNFVIRSTTDMTETGKFPKLSFTTSSRWIARSWDSITEDQILKSIKQCGVSLNTDGTEDELLHCFHVKGFEEGLQLLHTKRSKSTFCELDYSSTDRDFSDDSASYCDSDESN